MAGVSKDDSFKPHGKYADLPVGYCVSVGSIKTEAELTRNMGYGRWQLLGSLTTASPTSTVYVWQRMA